nr:unnamed protein product [Digitaria exilis]
MSRRRRWPQGTTLSGEGATPPAWQARPGAVAGRREAAGSGTSRSSSSGAQEEELDSGRGRAGGNGGRALGRRLWSAFEGETMEDEEMWWGQRGQTSSPGPIRAQVGCPRWCQIDIALLQINVFRRHQDEIHRHQIELRRR